jgi:Flp pilus assembly protein TadD
MARPRIIGLLLALITLAIYLPVIHYNFLIFDDNDYITDNSMVQNGLTWAGVKWAFTTWHGANWHPLTWLSHMLDCELFGLNAGMQHFVNVLFHAANVFLLLTLLFRLTNSLWPSALVAALFAWHPLHIESVAWISERKDVLSTFFELLALLAYTRFVQKPERVRIRLRTFDLRPPRSGFYWLALFLFALGLMAKSMVVTLPFVLLLLDYWPLQRFPNFKFESATALRLVLEKWPFFLLAVISCVVTFLAQNAGDAVKKLETVPLDLRLENALTAYVDYLSKMICPANLAVFYPFPKHIPLSSVLASSAVLIAISSAVWLARRRNPCLFVGWLWFLGTLIPVIGLVQVSGQSMADRYSYFPLVGIFMAIAFAGAEWIRQFQFSKTPVVMVITLILLGCVMATERQLRYWHDGISLFAHTLAVVKNNDFVHTNLGLALAQQNRLEEAVAEFREAAHLAPDQYYNHGNLGNLLDNLGRPEEALTEYQQAVQLKPDSSSLHDHLSDVLIELGRLDEAMTECTNAVQLDPVDPWPSYETGRVLLQRGRDNEAVRHFREALRLDPDNFEILAGVAHVLAAEENPKIRDGRTALVLAAKANALTGGQQPDVLDALGMACAETGDFDDAQELTQKAITLATAANIKKNIAGMQQRMAFYKKHQPWRESFNTSPKNLPALLLE